ncbi:MAG: 23S rRNA pseudouridine2457 synthase [Saprospiraceae bacterium]|jgi:23S rRNA pseudouridine2457 synthase
MFKYFLLHKPYNYLSQFTKEVPEHLTLADLGSFPKEVYPVGRLDKDSEGLLLLTDDKKLNHKLLNPAFKHPRTYWAQVEGLFNVQAMDTLRQGVDILINKKLYKTLPASVEILKEVKGIEDRDPPIRYRASIPTSWIQLTLIEGKNRQVRRMCAKVGFPVLRLVRASIGRLNLEGIPRGEFVERKEEDIYKAFDF